MSSNDSACRLHALPCSGLDCAATAATIAARVNTGLGEDTFPLDTAFAPPMLTQPSPLPSLPTQQPSGTE
eukprot:1158410-Pelagomonas_calceolata.AAC.10